MEGYETTTGGVVGWGCLGVNVSRWVKRKVVVVVVGAVVAVVVKYFGGYE